MKKLFITEIKKTLNNFEFLTLRNLYSPIVGVNAISFYSILHDYSEMSSNNRTFWPLEDVAKTLNMSINDLLIEKNKLEAVGLLRTFERVDENHFIFRINPPLDPVQFKKNSMLYNKAISIIGDHNFEKIYFFLKPNEILKDDFTEITAKFHDVFDLENVDEKQTTLEMPKIDFTNIDEAKRGLTPAQFVNYITGKKVTPTQLSLIQRLTNTSLSSNSINEIIMYSFDKNLKIVSKHIEVIALDMIKKGITNPSDIFSEMEAAKIIKQEVPVEEITFSDEIIDVNEEQVESSAESWGDIFDSLGGEL